MDPFPWQRSLPPGGLWRLRGQKGSFENLSNHFHVQIASIDLDQRSQVIFFAPPGSDDRSLLPTIESIFCESIPDQLPEEMSLNNIEDSR